MSSKTRRSLAIQAQSFLLILGANMTKILVTGGAGFLGHHFVEHILKNTEWQIIIFDKLSYSSSGFDRLRDVSCYDNKRIQIFTLDLTEEIPVGVVKEVGDVKYIIHLAAETHVDRSIDDPEPFVVTNVLGTMRMLNFARKMKNLAWFVYFSTDEVFGPAMPGTSHKEWARYNSTNPYSASKAGGEELCLAFANTYKLPVIVTHTMNIFGERQHPEKFIPMTIRNVLAHETVTIHSDSSKTISGSRFYIHARNVSSAILFLLHMARSRCKYNIVGEKEVSNFEMAKFIAAALNKPLHYEMVDFHSSRPGHDLRYALDGSLMRGLGWFIPVSFEDSLKKTLDWYLREENLGWLSEVNYE
jgi:dTDP-glucose 4,6-dehydratase